MPEILLFRWRFSRESRKAGKAIKKPVISGLNLEIWQAVISTERQTVHFDQLNEKNKMS